MPVRPVTGEIRRVDERWAIEKRCDIEARQSCFFFQLA
jgi:hypothetical protein